MLKTEQKILTSILKPHYIHDSGTDQNMYLLFAPADYIFQNNCEVLTIHVPAGLYRPACRGKHGHEWPQTYSFNTALLQLSASTENVDIHKRTR